ncbi:hypothetical protein [Calidifontibacter terrae]
MTGQEPNDDQPEFDRRFEELTSDWHSEEAERQSPQPAAPPVMPVIPAQWRATDRPSFLEDHDPGFTPPPPAPLPKDEMFWVTIGALVVGPLWLLYLFFFDRYTSGFWWAVAAGVFFAGVLLLVFRQPANRDDQDPDDDGARL